MKVCVLVFQLHVQLCQKNNIYKKVKCQQREEHFTSSTYLSQVTTVLPKSMDPYTTDCSCSLSRIPANFRSQNSCKGQTIGITWYNVYTEQAVQTWYNGLSCHSVSPVVYHCCTQGVQTLRIQVKVGLHTLQVIAL